MAPSAHLKTLCLGILLFSAVESARVKRQSANGACKPLPAPKNGKISCLDDGFDYTCTATCDASYEFKTKEASVSRGCDQFDGTWYDGKTIPECQPVCTLGCLNGGSCVEPDKCACVDGWRGSHCQHHGSLCNKPPGPMFGSIQCSADATATICTVACAPTFKFKTPPAAEYKCTPDGKWTPSKDSIPDCEPGQAVQPTGSTVHHVTGDATCVAWSQDHYRTFDNKIFTFQGKCRYLLTKDCAFNTFDIHVINDATCQAGSQCKRELDIYMGTTTLSLRHGANGPEVTWDKDKVTIPGARDGVVFEKIGSYIRVSSSLGFKVKWDGKESIFVQISDDLKGKTCGLCGRYDGDASNDFETDSGKVVSSAVSFGNSWKKSSLDGASCPDASQQSTCKSDTQLEIQHTNKANSLCQQLISDTAFSACHAVVDPQPYIEACKTDCCSTGSDSCMCNTFEAYSRECMQKKIKLTWRKTDRCPVACQGGMIYKECGSACQKKCQDTSATCNDDTCVDGCFCPDGTLLHDGQCISPASCPCEHNGKEFTQGGTIPKDCNTCTCKSGKWECTTKKCEATCSATGDPHYMTFDGKRFNFMGTCSYYLIYDPNFDVIVDNIKCGHGEASCTKSVTLDVNGQQIKLDHNHQLFVNGKEITKLPYKGQGIKIFMVSSLFMQAELDNGIKILWDGRTRAYITAPPAFMQKTKGLCGYFDGNQNNDFLTKEGDIETNTNAFGNRWKTEATCRDMPTVPQVHPCDLNAQRKAKATTECEQLKGDTFKACHGVVDVDQFYEDCLYDTCACTDNLKDCMCPNFGEYADTCASKGITINWRFEITECALQCTGGQEYQVCGSPCSRTCRNIAEHEACQERCVEGCNCPKGQTLNDDGECVHIEQCPCIFDEREYAAGYTTIKGTELCQCAGAKWQCQSLKTKDGSSVLPTDKPIQSLCEENKVYSTCVSSCPVTCDNVHDPPKCTTTNCEPGCICKPGFVKEGDKCVESTQCPCHHGGKAFFENDKIVMDCNECTCKSRKWECEMKDCPAICSTYGDSHYTTFDGKPFEFQGNCDYVLAKSTDTNSVKFSITTENIPCGTSGVTCTKAIEFSVGEPGEANFYRLNLVRGKPIQNEPGSPFHITEVGNYIYINTTFGITMQWDKGTTVYIRLANQHRNKVVGLCGNFNGDQKDDFQMPQGGPPAVKATTFGDSWKVHDYCAPSTVITDTCVASPHRKPWAQKKCGVMQSELFEPCHAVVPYNTYMDKCIFDACACDLGGDCECLCTAIAAYAHECAVKGVPIKWRSNELCAIECTDCSAYNPCISTCPKKTCDNRLVYDELTKSCKQDLCFEGCDVHPCPPGQVYDGTSVPMKCIPEPFCNTTACILNGREYREGERIVDQNICRSECEICTCTNGQLKRMGYCTGSTPFVAVPTAKPTASPTAHPVSSDVNPTSRVNGPTVMPPLCLTSGWTAWMSSSTPTHANTGDIETIDGLRKMYSFCGHDMMTAIDCRVVGQNTKAEMSGQKVTCDLREGLKCYHKDQTSGLCLDYEVRYHCDCSIAPSASPIFGQSGSPTAAPGTGTSGNPTSSPLLGGSGSPTAAPGTGTSGNPTASPNLGGSGNPTASPLLGGSGSPTSAPGTGTSGNPTAAPGTDSHGNPTASPNLGGSGNPTASPLLGGSGSPTSAPGTGTSGNPTAVPGTDTHGNPTASPNLGGSGNPTASPLLGGSGSPTSAPGTGTSGNPTAAPGTDSHGNPTASPNLGGSGNPTASPLLGGSGSPTAAPGTGTSGNPTATPGTGTNGNPTASPNLGGSGSPTSSPLFGGSGSPTAVPGTGSNGNPTASPNLGGSGNPTAAPGTDISGNPTASPSHGGVSGVPSIDHSNQPNMKCTRTGWTSWMNTDKPDGDGDHESLQEIRKVHPICDQSALTYIQCRKAGTGESYEKTSDVNTICTTMAGFMCANSNQPDGQCEDYEIRVFCSCSATLCNEKLMQELDYVKDSQFSSSTTYGETQEYAAKNARMGGQNTWKPEKTDAKPWIQVDFGEPVSVAGITTTGNTQHLEWVTSYQVMIGDMNCDKFQYMKGPDGQPETFTGNTDATTPVTHMLRQKQEAVKCLRVYPLKSNGGASMQFEILGCRDFLTVSPGATLMPPLELSGSPTASPHVGGSGSPSAVPVTGTNGNPTAAPGTGISGNPTSSPNLGGSGSPTAAPGTATNGNPTASPILGGSGNPTASPLFGGSGSPTASPGTGTNGNPTSSPLLGGSGSPTAAPGTGTSGNPTAVPGTGINGNPTASPVLGGSGSPTVAPGTGPNGNPTASPGQVTGGLPSTVSSNVMTKVPYTCKQDWSSWMNVDRPTISHSFENGGPGDHENLDALRYYYSFCAQPSSIQCRSATTGKMYHITDDKETTCNIQQGFSCVNSKQSNGKCDDYEISVFCDCGGSPTAVPTATPTFAPGLNTPLPGQPYQPAASCMWTPWMNSFTKKPGTDGDYETISNLRLKYPFCAHPAAIQCRAKPTTEHPDGIPYDKTGEMGVSCNLNRGLVCVDSMQPNGKSCMDYEVRMFCTDSCPSTIAPKGIPTAEPPKSETGFPTAAPVTGTSGKPTASPILGGSGSPTASPGTGTNGNPTASPGTGTDVNPTSSPHLGGSGSPTVAPGTNGTNGNPTASPVLGGSGSPTAAPGTGTTGNPTAAPGTGTNGNGNPTASPLLGGSGSPTAAPGTGTSGNPTSSPLLGGSGSPTAAPGTGTSGNPTASPNLGGSGNPTASPSGVSGVPTLDFCREGWTGWINTDTPNSGTGDIETVHGIVGYPKTCMKVLSTECRVASTKADYKSTGQQVTCDNSGLECINGNSQQCTDYEVRFYCYCGEQTTIPGEIPTANPSGVPTASPPSGVSGQPEAIVCNHGWTAMMNEGKPTDNEGGDLETIDKLRQANKFCDEGNIIAIECVVSGTETSYELTGQQVTCDKKAGLICFNSQQSNRQCLDYAVRFFCDCAQSTPYNPVITTYGIHGGSNTPGPQVEITTGSPIPGISGSPTASPGAGTNGNPTVSPNLSGSGSPTASPVLGGSGSPTASPGTGTNGNPTVSPHLSGSGSPTASPVLGGSGSPTASPGTGTNGNPTVSPHLSGSGSPTASPVLGGSGSPTAAPGTGTTAKPTASPVLGGSGSPTASPVFGGSGSPTASPGTGTNGNPTVSPHLSGSGSPTASPVLGGSGSPTAAPGTGTTGKPTASPVLGGSGSPTASPVLGGSGSPTASPGLGTNGNPTASPGTGTNGNQTSSPQLGGSGSPTAAPVIGGSGSPTAVPVIGGSGSPTAAPGTGSSGNPTASPGTGTNGNPTASPLAGGSGSPTAQPSEITTCVSYWSDWFNRDKPTIGGGDYEHVSVDELKNTFGFCSGGEISQIECFGLGTQAYSYSTGEQTQCDLKKGFTCNNIDNNPINCQDYQIRYFCQVCAPTLSPVAGQSGHPTPAPGKTGETGAPTAQPSAGTGMNPTAGPGEHFSGSPTASPQTGKSGEPTPAPNHGIDNSPNPMQTTHNVPVTKTTAIYTWTTTESIYHVSKQVCEIPMGTGNHALFGKDQFSASTSFDFSFEAHRGRLGTIPEGQLAGAWMPRISDRSQWIQVDLKHPEYITGVVTQGRPDMDHWVTKYAISTSIDGKTFFPYTESGETAAALFNGNSDRNTQVKGLFDHEILARYVRIHPVEWYGLIALRFDILSCTGLTSGPATNVPPHGSGSDRPTASPGILQSGSPTASPVSGGSGSPTASPSTGTNGNPTASPHLGGSGSPTAVPGTGAYGNLTVSPILGGSGSPTAVPGTGSNGNPTASPNLGVSGNPTAAPGTQTSLSPGVVCSLPMGVDSALTVKDNQLTSSGFTDSRFNAPAGRLFNEFGAWSPKVVNGDQWIMVNFLKPQVINGILTQGSPILDKWVTKFIISYSIDGFHFIPVTDLATGKSMTFAGNSDRNTVMKNIFPETISAQYLKISPVEWSPAGIGMRFNILGCYKPTTETPPTAGPSGNPTASPKFVATTGGVPMATPPSVSTLEPICTEPMGVENYRIVAGSQLTSSSEKDAQHGAISGRISEGTNTFSGAWVPSPTDKASWIQVDFLEQKVISGIVTQGSGKDNSWVETFTVSYSFDGKTFTPYSEVPDQSGKNFIGNKDSTTVMPNLFNRNIYARFIRISPITSHGATSLRFNVLGCNPSPVNPSIPTVSPGVSQGGLPTVGPGQTVKAGIPTASPPPGQSGLPTASPVIGQSGEPTVSPGTGQGGLPTASPGTGQGGLPTASPGLSGQSTPIFELTTPSVCLIPMGIENSYIVGNSQLSASSSIDDKHTAAVGRLFGTHGAWIPQSTVKPWIQVNFLKPLLISGVMTQGSPDVPKWVTKYNVYYGFNGIDFKPYTDIPGVTTPVTFNGNTDQTSPVRNLFNRDIIVQYVRIVPVEWSKDGIAMRFNILGCTRPQPVVPLPTASPSQTGGNPTASPGQTGGNPTASPGQTGGNPTASPGQTGGNPTASPGQTGGNPTASPGQIGGNPTPSPGQTGGNPTAHPGQTGGNPTASPGQTGGNPTAHPGQTGGNPTASPGQTGGNPTASPGQTGGNPTATPHYIDHGFPTFTPPSGSNINPTASPVNGQSTPNAFNKCDIPMGIENPGIIGGRQLSASSILKDFTGAERARPYTQKDGYYSGGWIPKYNDKKQWIQVDFGASYKIAGISTQGRSDAPTWVTKYEVYYGNDGHNFNPIFLTPTSSIPRVFEGNFDQSTPIMNVFPEVTARFIRIRPVEWHEAIGLRFNVFGCQLPSPTPSVGTFTKAPIATPSVAPNVNPTVNVGPTTAACMYWTPWVTTNTPDSNGEYESYWDAMNVVKICDGKYVKKIECRTVTSKTPYDQTGEKGVMCTVESKSLVCMNSDQNGGKVCSDYELRFFCDECSKPTPSPGQHIDFPTAAPKTCDTKWSDWINRHAPDAVGETETVAKEDLDKHCPGGTVAEVECNTAVDSQAYYLSGDVVTCDAQTGLTCKHSDNVPLKCHDYKIRFKCKCESQPTAGPGGKIPGGQPTAAPGTSCTTSNWTPWFNTDKPDVGGGDYEKITPEQEKQYCVGGKLTKVECVTTTGIDYYSTGEVMQCTIAGGSSCNNGDNFPVPCSDYKVRYYCECTAPTASPGVGPDGHPTASPVHSGQSGSPTASPGTTSCTKTQWTPWVNNDKPTTGKGDHETLTPEQMSQYCAGGRLAKIECRTSTGIEYYSSGDNMKCDLVNGALCNNVDNAPIQCQDYEVRYYCECPAPTAGPHLDHSGSPTATPPSTNGGHPSASPQSQCSVSKWSSWINRDNPASGDGDFESMTAQEKTQFCPGGEITEVKCETAAGIPSYSSGELMTCNKIQGLVCKNSDNFPVPCSDYQIMYYCKCSPTASPPTGNGNPTAGPSGQTGHPTASPGTQHGGQPTAGPGTGISGEPTAQPGKDHSGSPTASPVVTTCSQSHFSNWVDRDLPETGNGDHESMTPEELAAFCQGGKVTKVECYTGDIPSYSSGELMTCDLKNGVVCNNADNFPVTCSNYKIRYFCDCSGVPQPVTQTPPDRKYSIHCDWSPWINTGTPDAGHGDMETIDAIKTKHGVCKDMAKIECRIAGTNTMSSASGQSRVTCDINNGLRCYNNEQLSKKCYDYEVRVLCWDNTCTGTMPTAGPTETPYKTPTGSPQLPQGTTLAPQEKTTTAVCPPGKMWNACAYTCDDVCNAVSGDICDGKNPQQCVPGCKDHTLTGPKCTNGEKLSYTGQCVKAELCPCKKSDGSIAQAFEYYTSPTDQCSKCHCFNNTDVCQKEDHCMPTAAPSIIPTAHPKCDWTNWINVDKPTTGDGDIESILKIRTSHSICAHPISIECREASTKTAAMSFGEKVSCDIVNGFRCFSWENHGTCSDYEVRFYCPCASTVSPNVGPGGLPTASPGTQSGHPTASPGTSGLPTSSPGTQSGHPTPSPGTGTGGLPTASPGTHSGLPTASPIFCGWSAWTNSDHPSISNPNKPFEGDIESIASLMTKTSVCSHDMMKIVECRVASTKQPASATGQVVTCDAMRGLRCDNSKQGQNGKCLDYEMRVFCDCSALPTASPGQGGLPTASPVTGNGGQPTAAPNSCGWSTWMNSHAPDNTGEMEQLPTLRTQFQFCKTEDITGIECRNRQTQQSVAESGQTDVICDLRYSGLMCINSKQTATGGRCYDYEVRVLCEPKGVDCSKMPTASPGTGPGGLPTASPGTQSGHPTASPGTGTGGVPTSSPGTQSGHSTVSPGTGPGGLPTASPGTQSGHPTASPGTGTSGLPTSSPGTQSGHPTASPGIGPGGLPTAQPPQMTTCAAYWSQWINTDKPESGGGDFEHVSPQELASKYNFCNGGEVTKIECHGAEMDAEYYSTGDVNACDLKKGLSCKNADNVPIICQDYKIRYFCEVCAPVLTPTSSPTASGGMPTTPVLVCPNPMTNTASLNVPDHYLTASSSLSAYAGPQRSRIDAVSDKVYTGAWMPKIMDKGQWIEARFDHPEYINAILTKGREGSAQWVKAFMVAYSIDGKTFHYYEETPGTPKLFNGNFDGDTQVKTVLKPIIAKYVRIQPMAWEGAIALRFSLIGCRAPEQVLPTAAPSSGTLGHPTAAPQQSCVTSTWSKWINRNSNPDGDYESMTKEEIGVFCPAGSIDKVECETVDGIASYSTGEVMECTPTKGLVCNNVDNFPIPCSNYKIRYHCKCSEIPTAGPGHTGSGVPTASPGHTGNGLPTASPGQSGHPTASPQQSCVTSTFSQWFNRNTNPDGDYESMTKEEIAAFCPAGSIDKVECETVDGIPSYSTGEIMECTPTKGLVCNNADNFPIPCSNYKIRYHCKCSETPTAGPGHTGSGVPTASPGQTGSGIPTASPGQSGLPTASPVKLTAMPTPNIPSGCKEEMGMKNGFIRNDMITASSYRDGRHSPSGARLGSISSWLSATEDRNQYIQVNFLAPRIITGVTTQGRPDAPSYVTSYKVFYSYDGTNWSPYRETKGEDKVFSGNFDNVTPVTNTFMTPIRAQYIRINPQTWNQMISMRFEIHGCFENYPTSMPPSANPLNPTASPSNPLGQHPTASPPSSQTLSPLLTAGCVIWDQWINQHHVTLTSNGDHEPIDEVRKASSTCQQPMSIECRTATPDHTASDKTGQKVSCNLWEGLLCKNADQKEPMCFNYEVRLGCLKQTPECLAKIPTANPSGSPQISPTVNPNIVPCYTGMDLSRCPKDGCATGSFCDGLKCVTKSECPCLIEGHVVLPGQISQNTYCDTCQCVGGEVKCLPMTCPTCQGGLSSLLDKNTCKCQCQACAANEYKCGTGQCIPQAARCDGVADCTTDEFECMSTPLFTMPGVPTPKPTMPGAFTPTASPQRHSYDPNFSKSTPSVDIFVPTTGPKGNDLHTTRTKVVTTGMTPNATSNLPPHGPKPVACATVQCSPLVRPALKQGEIAQIVKTTDGCCEEYLVVCEPQQCPAISTDCMKPEVMTRTISGDRCCPEYTCVCPPKCPVPTEPPCAFGSQVVEIVIGCNCTTKACVAGTPVPMLAVTTVPPPQICRYMVTKKVENGKEVDLQPPTEVIHAIGETWSDGLCKTCQCVNSTHGTPETSCKQQQCPDCKLGEERRTKANSCCGECVQTGCVVNGTVYKTDEKIQSNQKCFEMACTKQFMTGDFILQTTQVQCERMEKLPKCVGNEDKYDVTGCCLRCVPTEMLPTNSSSVCQSCIPRLMFGQPHQSVSFFKVKDNGEDCENVEPVNDLKECSGYCGSTSSYTNVMRGFDNKCQCCQPDRTVTKTVELVCSSNRKITKTYTVPETCGCRACAGGA